MSNNTPNITKLTSVILEQNAAPDKIRFRVWSSYLERVLFVHCLRKAGIFGHR